MPNCSGPADITRFVTINKRTGQSHIIFTPGIYSVDQLTYSNGFKPYGFHNKSAAYSEDAVSVGKGHVAWTEMITDKRWGNKSYSVIKIGSWSLESGKRKLKVKQLTHKSRYFAPAISPDGTMLIAVHVSYDNHYSLDLLDIKNGKKLKTLIGSDKEFYIYPSWKPDGKALVVICLDNNGKRMDIVDVRTGKSRTVLKPAFYDIYAPQFYGKYIFYNSPYSGIDNIYALDTAYW